VGDCKAGLAALEEQAVGVACGRENVGRGRGGHGKGLVRKVGATGTTASTGQVLQEKLQYNKHHIS
jgi:hypothetical protein